MNEEVICRRLFPPWTWESIWLHKSMDRGEEEGFKEYSADPHGISNFLAAGSEDLTLKHSSGVLPRTCLFVSMSVHTPRCRELTVNVKFL